MKKRRKKCGNGILSESNKRWQKGGSDCRGRRLSIRIYFFSLMQAYSDTDVDGILICREICRSSSLNSLFLSANVQLNHYYYLFFVIISLNHLRSNYTLWEKYLSVIKYSCRSPFFNRNVFRQLLLHQYCLWQVLYTAFLFFS